MVQETKARLHTPAQTTRTSPSELTIYVACIAAAVLPIQGNGNIFQTEQILLKPQITETSPVDDGSINAPCPRRHRHRTTSVNHTQWKWFVLARNLCIATGVLKKSRHSCCRPCIKVTLYWNWTCCNLDPVVSKKHPFQHQQCSIQTISTGILPVRFQGHARCKSVLLWMVCDSMPSFRGRFTIYH